MIYECIDEYSQCPIMIGNNAHVDTSNNEPDAEFDTSLRVLEVSRPSKDKERFVTLW